MDTLTALASAAFGSTVYLTALSTVKWLNQRDPKAKTIGLIATGIVLCAVIGLIAVASKSVVVGFIVGAVLTPPVHRILQRRKQVIRS
ncbi:hypothetical protein [Streptomyces sp. H021]|uniref:hypothetical protein n=1 Tax=Streptomyces sp. H021 TaxID=1519486 RepID=UPI0006AE36B8|nr:hypothetical protein [Streptomyces sp. H021]KOV43620.1 hypothetical protein ADK97_05625 [Streptomyces sp. H021]